MADFIEKMKEKPDHVKRAYAFWLSAGITGIITLVWISTLPTRFAALTEPRKANATAESAQYAAVGNAPVESLSSTLSGGIKKIKSLFGEPKAPEPETVKLETTAVSQSALSGAVLITDPYDVPVSPDDPDFSGSASVYTP